MSTPTELLLDGLESATYRIAGERNHYRSLAVHYAGFVNESSIPLPKLDPENQTRCLCEGCGRAKDQVLYFEAQLRVIREIGGHIGFATEGYVFVPNDGSPATAASHQAWMLFYSVVDHYWEKALEANACVKPS